MDEDTRIGPRVRAARERQGMSLRVLAAAADISPSFLSRAERGERALDRRSTVQRIAEALHVPLTDLTGQPYRPRSRDEVRARAAVVDLRDILHGLRLGDLVDVDPRPLDELERLTWRVRQLAIASDFGGYGPLLPDLVLDLHAHAGPDPAARPQALRLLMSAAHTAHWLAQSLGATELASLAAARAVDAAAQLEDPDAAGYAQWLTWLASLRYGRHTQARAVRDVAAVADQLQAHAGEAGPAAEMYGTMHLVQAYAAMVGGEHARAGDHLDEAEATARLTGDTTTHDVWFGPTEVAAQRVSVASEVGADDDALAAAAMVDPTRMASPSRRASHYLDVARSAAGQRRTRRRAQDLLIEAERLAPQYVRTHPAARETVAELLAAAGGAQLRGLAKRVGVLTA